jgi:cytoplasmic FMR1 interacting protein
MALIDKVRQLQDFTLEDNSPNIESAPLSITYEISPMRNPVNYVDQVAFDTDFAQDIEAIAEMQLILEDGEYFVNLLYGFRSCSRALPMVTDANQQDKMDIHTKTFQVLRPEITKLKRLMEFHEKVIKLFVKNTQTLASPDRQKSPIPSETFSSLVKIIDLLLKLDNLKDMKACLQNDFSFYKRSFQHVRKEMPEDEADQISAEVHNLQMFLGNPAHPKSLIFHNLKTAVKRIPNHQDVLISMLTKVLQNLDTDLFVFPEEKWGLLRVMPHILLLLDEDRANKSSFNVFKSKKIALSRIQKFSRRFPVVPVFGDMSIKLIEILRRCEHWDADEMASAWGALESDAKVARGYSLLESWGTGDSLRAQSDAFCPKLVAVLNEIDTCKVGVGEVDVELAWRVYNLVKDGVLLCSTWTQMVLEQSAWKYQHPASDDVLRKRQQELGVHAPAAGDEEDMSKMLGREYEKVVRYNYSAEELSVLVDAISLIKGLSALLIRAQASVAPVLRLSMHRQVQVFLQHTLSTLLHRADKRKRPVKATLMQLRTLGADWLNGVEPFEDYKAKRAERLSKPAEIKGRYLSMGPTQLLLARTVCEGLHDERAPGMQAGGVFSKKDFAGEEVEWLEEFARDTFFFPYLLNLEETVRRCSDLSDLWYREFYLEMTKQLQFPIAMSLPWILTEHVIDNPDSLTYLMVENILYALDIYNDVGHKALHLLQHKCLYAEVEAEVKLVFTQLVVLLGNNIYTYHKDLAAAQSLDGQYVAKMQKIYKGKAKDGQGYLSNAKRRNEVPMLQRHIQLLGRSVDLCGQLAKWLSERLHDDVELALNRLESSDLTHVIEFESQLHAVRKTHELLSLTVQLEPWEHILGNANEELNPYSFHSRIRDHIVVMMMKDVIPNYSYNAYTRRFIPAPVKINAQGAEDEKQKKHAAGADFMLYGKQCKRAYERVDRLRQGFFGAPHMQCIARLLGTARLPTLVDFLVENMEVLLETDLAMWDANTIHKMLPPVKLPKFVYKSGGCYAFFEGKLMTFLSYKDTKASVFQSYRVVGNTLAVIELLDAVLETEAVMSANFNAPFRGVTPANPGGSEPGATPVMRAARAFVQNATNEQEVLQAPATLPFFLGTGVSAQGPAVQGAVQRSQDIDMYARAGNGFLPTVLLRLSAALDRAGLRKEWEGGQPDGAGAPAAGNAQLLQAEHTCDFYRLWSAWMFLFCMHEDQTPDAEGIVRPTDEAEFGDGFLLAGAAFTHLLGQRDRFELLDFSYVQRAVVPLQRLSCLLLLFLFVCLFTHHHHCTAHTVACGGIACQHADSFPCRPCLCLLQVPRAERAQLRAGLQQGLDPGGRPAAGGDAELRQQRGRRDAEQDQRLHRAGRPREARQLPLLLAAGEVAHGCACRAGQRVARVPPAQGGLQPRPQQPAALCGDDRQGAVLILKKVL